MKTKKQTQPDKKQPSLYGDVDELYNLLSAHESADKEAVDGAQKRVTNAKENLLEVEAQLDNTQRAMSIVERRLEELKPKGKKTVEEKVEETKEKVSKKIAKEEKKKKEAAQRKARLTGKRDKPEGDAPEPTPPPPESNVKKKK